LARKIPGLHGLASLLLSPTSRRSSVRHNRGGCPSPSFISCRFRALMIVMQGRPDGWINKEELLEQLKPISVSDDQLKEWARDELIQHPGKDYKGHRGARSYYAPDTPNRIR